MASVQAALSIGPEGSVEGNFDFGIAARNGRIHGGNYPLNIAAQNRPLSVSKRNDSNLPARQVLLIPDVLVCRDKHLEPRGFGGFEQGAVEQPLPSAFHRLNGHLAFQGVSERGWRTVVKRDEHLPSMSPAPAAAEMGRDFAPQIRGP